MCLPGKDHGKCILPSFFVIFGLSRVFTVAIFSHHFQHHVSLFGGKRAEKWGSKMNKKNGPQEWLP